MNGRKEKDNDREERILKDRQKIKDRVPQWARNGFEFFEE